MRKLIVGILCGMTVIGSSVVFADVTDVKLIGNECVAIGTINEGEPISVVVTKGGAPAADYSNVITFDSTYRMSAGEFTYPVKMEESRIGNSSQISVFVKVGSNSEKEFILEYVSQNDIEELINRLKNASDADEIKSIINNSENENILEGMGWDLTGWNKCDKDNASEILYNMKAVFSGSLPEIEKAYELSVSLSAFEGDVEKVNKLSKVFCGDVTWESVKVDDERAKQIIGYMKSRKTYSGIEDFNNSFGLANVFYEILSTPDYDDINEIIDDNKDLLEVEGQDFYLYYKSNKNKVLRLVIPDAKKNGISSLKDFHKLMDKAVDECKKDKNTGNKVSSSGSGGGGSRGGSVMITTPKTEEKENNANDSEISATAFSDVPGSHWGAGEIEELYDMGIINGYEDGSFRPDNKVTREEFVTMIIKATDTLLLGGTTPFRDVEYAKWYTPYVTTAYRDGMVTGIGRNEFGIGKEITRQDATVILSRLTDETLAPVMEYAEYNDSESIADYAKAGVRRMTELGVIKGSDGIFRPGDSISRAEAAAIIRRFMKLK